MMVRGLCMAIACFTWLQGANAGEIGENSKNEFSGSIEFGGYKTSGNTKTETFDGKFELGHRYDKWSNTLTLTATKVSEDGVISSDYYQAIFKSIYDLPLHFYTFAQLGYREDAFGGIFYEKSYVGGFGYHAFTAEPRYSLDFELGYGQRVTKKLDVIGGLIAKLDYDPGKYVAIIGQYLFSKEDKLKMSLSGEFGNDDDYFQSELAWVHQLFDELHLDFSYESRTLSKPGAGKVATDDKISVKVGYTF